ncbi:CoA ester lyase [Henriciella sp. AS95]|uniref:HpcH/HpaI aldolase/citrate lyase family protein n=1 Tax=Henriciella sp. AS95 TaxID=3135782 RepID=UPI0031826B1F
MAIRSLLFVPGSRPDRFEKALATAADLVVIDLEDAVLPDEKDVARQTVVDVLSGSAQTGRLAVRINSPRTFYGCADIAAIAASTASPAAIMVPKVEHEVDLEIASEALGALGQALVPVIETGRGLENAYAIARHEAVSSLLFGGADFSAELGTGLDWEALAYARGRLVSLASSAGKAIIDVPFLDVGDADALAAEAARVKAIGFDGKACIHPAQVETVNTVFSPTAEDVKAASRVLDAFRKAEGGAVLLDGKLIDRPVVLAAERTLSKAQQGAG